MPSYDSVINKLVEKSEAGTVPWKPTFSDDTFIAALEGEVTFEVAKLEDGSFEFRMKDKDGKKIIDLICYSRIPWEMAKDDVYFEQVKRLFEAARIKALEVDKKLAVAESLLDRF